MNFSNFFKPFNICAAVAAPFLIGIGLLAMADSPQGEPDPVDEVADYVRVGTTSRYLVDIHKGSLKVEWPDYGTKAKRVWATFRMQAGAPRLMMNGVEVEYTLNEVDANCHTMTIDVVKSTYIDHDGKTIAVSKYRGPLSKWIMFGEKEADAILAAFCTYRKPIKKPPTV